MGQKFIELLATSNHAVRVSELDSAYAGL